MKDTTTSKKAQSKKAQSKKAQSKKSQSKKSQPKTHPTAPTAMEYRAIGWQSYMWGWPLVDMYIQKEKRTSGYGGNGSNAPINNFGYAQVLNDNHWRTGLYPNCDLLYTMAQVDLSQGPVVVAVPDVDAAGDRYFSIPMYDAYNHVFASFGTLQTVQGNPRPAGDYLIVGPQDVGKEFEGDFEGVVESPSDYAWIAARTMVFLDQDGSPDADYDAAREFAFQYKVTEHSIFKDSGHKVQEAFSKDQPGDNPGVPTGMDFFNKLRTILESDETLWPERERFLAQQFMSLNLSDTDVQDALLDAEKDCVDFFLSRSPGVLRTNWNYLYGLGDYQETPHRAHVGYIGGAAANEAHEAFYPLGLHASDGADFHGSNDYSMFFESYEIDPVPLADDRGYWSLTIYDKDRNPTTGLDFWSMGSRNHLETDDDGHLTIHVTSDTSKKNRPGHYYLYSRPNQKFSVVFRTYLPSEKVISYEWPIPELKLDSAIPKK